MKSSIKEAWNIFCCCLDFFGLKDTHSYLYDYWGVSKYFQSKFRNILIFMPSVSIHNTLLQKIFMCPIKKKKLLKDAQFRIIVSQDSRTHNELYYKPFLYSSVPVLGKLHILMTKSRATILINLMGAQPCLFFVKCLWLPHATVAGVSTCKRDWVSWKV